MPECRDVIDLLSAYLDRDLPADTCSTIERHLDTCADCGESARALRETVGMCKQFRASEVPAPLAPGQHAELKAAFTRALRTLRGEQ